MKNSKSILLVEDDVVDLMTVKRALNQINVNNTVFAAGNGEEALAFLKNNTQELPGIILLDLNMPRMSGIEFLQVMKNDDAIKQIPVVVLTTSKEENDKTESFKLGVAGYMIKPVDYEDFVETMRIIDQYWTVSELPE